MGLIGTLAGPWLEDFSSKNTGIFLASSFAVFIALSILINVLRQFLIKNPNEPPIVFHWVPFIGSTITYGMEPYKFFFACHEKYGDVFTFILLGRKVTVCLGTKGNEFILNGKLKDVNAEEVYSPLTTPVFGHDVVYDCPNSKLMEQKKFVKFGLDTKSFQSYVPLIVAEVENFLKTSKWFQGAQGTVDVPNAMAELTIYTASRSLQGKEVRDKFDSTFADLYHDLDMGFSPINFMLPWAPLPHNRRRDRANRKMARTYMDIIEARRETGGKRDAEDMIWNLMGCVYKDGTEVPDKEVAHMMIALLMAGQHSSSSTSSWIVLRLAQNPELAEELFDEQKRVLGDDPLTYDNISKLTLHAQVVKETLRIHAPIHSIMRKVKSPMPVSGTPFVIPTTHTLLAAPGFTSKVDEYFPQPDIWDPHRWDAGKMSLPTEVEEKEDYGYGLINKGASGPYLPFGAGRHRCIGEQFAYLQLQTVIASLIRELRFKNVGGSKDIVETDYSSLFSQPLRPANVEWERRRPLAGGDDRLKSA